MSHQDVNLEEIERRRERLFERFNGEFSRADYEGGSIAIQSGELNGAAWFADPPAQERPDPTTERLLDGRVATESHS